MTFVLFFASPVDVTRYACGKNCTQEKRAQTEKALGYDKPVIVQWTDFLKGIVVGRDYPDDPALQAAAPDIVTHCGAPCFGYSQVNGKTVNELVKEAAPVSISLAVVALFIWVTLGILFGLLAAVRRDPSSIGGSWA